MPFMLTIVGLAFSQTSNFFRKKNNAGNIGPAPDGYLAITVLADNIGGKVT